MMFIPVYDDSEVVELNAAYHLYLKPKAKLIITVILPEETDQCRPVSHLDVQEKLKDLVAPDHFSSLRVSKSTRECIRLDGETDTKRLSGICVEKLNGQSLQLDTLSTPLSIEVTEAPVAFPANEKDTELLSETEESLVTVDENTVPVCIHLEGLPCKWFSDISTNTEKPSEEVLKSTFEKYGKIANVDIPMLDPYREESDGSLLTPGGLQPFHAFLQYEDRLSAIDAIQSLQGMKLIFTAEDGKSLACDIKVSVDTTNHFSEEAVNKRSAERLKLQELEQQRKQENEEEAERKRKAEERKSRARRRRARLKRKLQRQKEREENGEQEQDVCPEEAVEDTQEWEDRKLVLAHRRLESIKLLMVLLDKVNDLVQVNRLEEEQMNCEFVEEFSDCSVSTYSENSKVMFLPVTEEEEQEIVMDMTEDEVEIIIPEEDAESYRPSDRRDSFSEINHQTLNYDEYLDTEEIQVTKMHYYDEHHEDHPIIKLSHSQDVSDERCSKKQKIYETDEFINYLLNYYRSPEYARLFLETEESPRTSWCRREVSWKGNGFQIKLLNGHFEEINFIPELEEETDDECSQLETPHPKVEESSQVTSVSRKPARESQEGFVDSEPEVPMTKPKVCSAKSYERRHKRAWHEEEDSDSTESNEELGQVLEEISSTSEYFSEGLDGHSGKQSNSRKLSKKQRKVKQLNKLKQCKVSGHNQVCQHDDLLGQLLHSYCQKLKKRSRCKLTKTCQRKPSFSNLYDSDTNESDSDQSAEVQTRWKRKRSKITDRACFLEEMKLKKKRYSSSEGESSDPHEQEDIIRQGQHKLKPQHKMLKTGSCDEKLKKEWKLYYAEDVSESPEQDESSWYGEETQSSSSFSSNEPTEEKEPRPVSKKASYTDYLDWENHFYAGDEGES